MHERQAVVFGLLIAFLAVCGIGALAIYTGAIDAPFARSFSSPAIDDPHADVPTPCIPDETLPVAYDRVSIEVLNGSGVSGLGQAYRDLLTSRGFTVTDIRNLQNDIGQNVTTPRTSLTFGAEGAAAAYTLAAHLHDAALLLDDREGAEVQLVLGENFERLVELDDVELDPETPLSPLEDCTSIEEITPLPGPTEDEEPEDEE